MFLVWKMLLVIMSELTKYCVVLDNLHKIYYSGQNVTGKVIVHVKEEIQFKGIYVKIVGKCELPNYTSSFFDTEKSAIGAENLTSLKPGKYEFLFSVELPIHLPSSFQGDFGTIRYICSSKFDQPFKFDPNCKTDIFVLELIDLNLIHNAALMAKSENYEQTGFCCRRTGTVFVSVSINKQGFVPGETMYIQANLINNSQVHIESTSAEIICDLYFAYGKHGTRQSFELCSIVRPAIPIGSSDKWTDVGFQIPALSPTQNGNLCNLIDLSYTFQFEVHLEGAFTPNIKVRFPITIGSVPLKKDFSTFIPETESNAKFKLPKIRQYPDLPSPSYKEYEYGKMGFNSNTYNTRYMFYKKNQQIENENKNSKF